MIPGRRPLIAVRLGAVVIARRRGQHPLAYGPEVAAYAQENGRSREELGGCGFLSPASANATSSRGVWLLATSTVVVPMRRATKRWRSDTRPKKANRVNAYVNDLGLRFD
jgi:hypothetical protein